MFIGIPLKLTFNLGRGDIFTILKFPIHEQNGFPFIWSFFYIFKERLLMVLVVKKKTAYQGTRRKRLPGFGRCPEGGHGNPLQYSCLENPMDTGAWCATVHRVRKRQTRLKQLNPYTGTCLCNRSILTVRNLTLCYLSRFFSKEEIDW